MNRLQQQESENEWQLLQIKGDIEEERAKTELLSVQVENSNARAAMDGLAEATRVQIAWQDPFMASELFLLKPDHVPGDYGFDPLGLAKGRDDAWLDDMKMRELNNGRVAMIAISGMVAQELVQRVNLLAADYVAGLRGPEALRQLEERCADTANEAACAEAFAAAEKAAVVSDLSFALFLRRRERGLKDRLRSSVPRERDDAARRRDVTDGDQR